MNEDEQADLLEGIIALTLLSDQQFLLLKDQIIDVVVAASTAIENQAGNLLIEEAWKALCELLLNQTHLPES